MEAYLNSCHILIKDFGQLVERTTQAVKEQARALAAKAGRPFIFVPSSQTSKEDLVRKVAGQDQITAGLIAVLNAVEPCQSFRVVGNRQTKQIEQTTASSSVGSALPQVQLHFSAAGVEALVRYPVQLQHEAEIDERVSRELMKVIAGSAAQTAG